MTCPECRGSGVYIGAGTQAPAPCRTCTVSNPCVAVSNTYLEDLLARQGVRHAAGTWSIPNDHPGAWYRHTADEVAEVPSGAVRRMNAEGTALEWHTPDTRLPLGDRNDVINYLGRPVWRDDRTDAEMRALGWYRSGGEAPGSLVDVDYAAAEEKVTALALDPGCPVGSRSGRGTKTMMFLPERGPDKKLDIRPEDREAMAELLTNAAGDFARFSYSQTQIDAVRRNAGLVTSNELAEEVFGYQSFEEDDTGDEDDEVSILNVLVTPPTEAQRQAFDAFVIRAREQNLDVDWANLKLSDFMPQRRLKSGD